MVPACCQHSQFFQRHSCIISPGLWCSIVNQWWHLQTVISHTNKHSQLHIYRSNSDNIMPTLERNAESFIGPKHSRHWTTATPIECLYTFNRCKQDWKNFQAESRFHSPRKPLFYWNFKRESHRFDEHLISRPEDSNSNFTTVGCKYTLEGRIFHSLLCNLHTKTDVKAELSPSQRIIALESQFQHPRWAAFGLFWVGWQVAFLHCSRPCTTESPSSCEKL